MNVKRVLVANCTQTQIGIPYYGITDDSDEEDNGFGASDNLMLTPQPAKPKELSLSYLATLNRPRSNTGRFLSVHISTLFLLLSTKLISQNAERRVDQTWSVEDYGLGKRHKWHSNNNDNNLRTQSWRLKEYRKAITANKHQLIRNKVL